MSGTANRDTLKFSLELLRRVPRTKKHAGWEAGDFQQPNGWSSQRFFRRDSAQQRTIAAKDTGICQWYL
jgi:hypothetical protein